MGATMQWTTDKPTRPGWYWVYVPRLKTVFCMETEIIPACDWIQFVYHVDGYDWESDFEPTDVSHWVGPLELPKPPTE